MSPWALLFVYKFTFLLVVYFHQSMLAIVLCIYGLFAAAGERQGSDTLEAVKSCLFANKDVCFLFSRSVPCVATRGRNTTETGVKKI